MNELFDFQRQAIQYLLEKDRHLLCIASTGSGKSRIVYELLNLNWRVLVLVPLVALKNQHIRNIAALNLKNGLLSEQSLVINPESLSSRSTKAWLNKGPVHLLVVDEAHCVGEWGNAFRPSYLTVFDLFKSSAGFTIERSLWLTATLYSEGKQELQTKLSSAANRPLHLEVQGEVQFSKTLDMQAYRLPWSQRLAFVLSQVNKLAQCGAGLVFVRTQTAAENLARLLHLPYFHAGLSSEEKANLQALLAQGKINGLVATSAFGMGMDIQSISWVIIFQFPYSLISAFQMLGRAGRQGKRGVSYIYWDFIDFSDLPELERERCMRFVNGVEKAKSQCQSGTDTAALEAKDFLN